MTPRDEFLARLARYHAQFRRARSPLRRLARGVLLALACGVVLVAALWLVHQLSGGGKVW